MLFNTIKILNTAIFLAISGIHFYWALGRKWGITNSVPELDGKKVLKTSALASVVVALGLLYFAIQSFIATEAISGQLSHWSTKYTLWAIGSIFLIRAIGDFKYVGFFKRIKNSRFAELDSSFYSPLCLLISVNAFYEAWIV